VLDAVRLEGVEIRGLSTEEARLETLYGELIGAPTPTTDHGESEARPT
jgi:hypothetical protein